VALPAGDESAEVVEPREQALDLPAPAVAAERSTVLGLPALPGPSVRGDQLDPSRSQPLIQRVAVIGPVTDQPLRGVLEESVVDRLFDERDLMR
jgi:hypothetical protein